MNNSLIIAGHGMGDCLMAFQCAEFMKDFGNEPEIIISTREEVYEPLSYLFSSTYKMSRIDETYSANNNLLKDESLFKFVANGKSEVYYVIPDLLFNNSKSFDYLKYHTSPQLIRSRRLLNKGRVTSKSIYLGIMSTTSGYSYSEPMSLALALAYEMPQYTIHFPIITQWAGKELPKIDIPNKLPSNLVIHTNQSLSDSIGILKECQYFIGTDNGPSHLAFHMGMPRLLLDPQYNRLPWIARWREDYLESVPISSSIESLVEVVNINISTPQTTLIPRMTCLVHGKANWEQLLWLKTQ